MMEDTQYMSQDKLDQLKAEYSDLKLEKISAIAKRIDEARQLGDLSENAEYHEARELQANIEDRIAKLESIMKNSTIVSRESPQGEYVRIGSTVIVEKQGGKVQQKFKIVGSEETDMLQGKLSNRCPLGVAILGKKAGDSFSFNSPAGIMIYKVITIE